MAWRRAPGSPPSSCRRTPSGCRPSLDGRFDVVFASYGVLAWIRDVIAWMGGAARALRPGGQLVLVADTVQHAHSLGEVVTAAAAAGLVVRELREYLDVESDDRDMLVRGDDGRYRLPFGDQYLPVLYSLVAGESPSSQPGA